MDKRFVDLRSGKNGKARIKILKGHFATKNSHVNTYIDMSTVKTRHNNARETAKTRIYDKYTGRNNRMPEKYGSDRSVYGRISVRKRKCIGQCGE